MDSPFWIYCVGLSAQIFFVGRSIVQWYLSEKNGRNESPALYWLFSLAGSVILFLYGCLRDDFSIIFGELLTYYIYMWNIGAKGLFKGKPKALPVALLLLPAAVVAVLMHDFPRFCDSFFRNESMPAALLALGLAGQIVFKSRFIYQWIYSFRKGDSLLPLSFWIISTVGSVLIITYAVLRHDWVLLAGQFGIIFSIRNIMIALSRKPNDETTD